MPRILLLLDVMLSPRFLALAGRVPLSEDGPRLADSPSGACLSLIPSTEELWPEINLDKSWLELAELI